MIKQATTQTEYHECTEYLKGKQAYILPDTALFFIRDNTGKLTAVAGFNRHTGSAIEPLYAEDRISALKMLYFMLGVLKGYGSAYVIIRTRNDKVINYIIEKEKFLIYNTQNNEFYKEI